MTTFSVVPADFRTNMGGTRLSTRKGFAAITSQGFSVMEPGGGIYTQDWGTIRNIEVPIKMSGNLVSAIGFDGTLFQACVPNTDFPLDVMAAWASLRPADIERGGASLQFQPGGWQMPALLSVAGQWSGGDTQVKGLIREWAANVQGGMTQETVAESRSALFPSPANEYEREAFWDARARRIVQRELDLLAAEMRDLTFSSTRGAILAADFSPIAAVWLAVTHQRELWLLYFPGLDPILRPSIGIDHVAFALPGDLGYLSAENRDNEPGVFARFDLERIASLEVMPHNAGRGVVVLDTYGLPGAQISSISDLPTRLILGVDGEVGWEGVRAVLDRYGR